MRPQFIWAIGLVGLVGCDAKIVTGEESEAVAKLRSGAYELVKAADLAQLRRDAAIGTSVGRFEHFASGFRTWRLDSATGAVCILLAPETDQKEPKLAPSWC